MSHPSYKKVIIIGYDATLQMKEKILESSGLITVDVDIVSQAHIVIREAKKILQNKNYYFKGHEIEQLVKPRILTKDILIRDTKTRAVEN